MPKAQKPREKLTTTLQTGPSYTSPSLADTKSREEGEPQGATPSEAARYSHGFLLAPGSSVWPANMNQVGRPSGIRNNGSVATPTPTPQGDRGRGRRGRGSGRKTPSRPGTPNDHFLVASAGAREGVGTRRTEGHAGDVDLQYEALMTQKIKLCRDGRREDANRIQAAVNVGVVLGWMKCDVLEVVEKMRQYLNDKAEDKERVVGYDDKMMEVAAEEEILRFESNVRAEAEHAWRDNALLDFHGQPRDFGYERFRFLRHSFSPKGIDHAVSSRPGLHAPLLLVKIQAALNVAMASFVSQPGGSNGRHDTGSATLGLQDFDPEIFKYKAVRYLLRPQRQVSDEITSLLRNSKAAKNAPEGVPAKMLVGIDSPLTASEEHDILDEFLATFPTSTTIVEALLDVLPAVDEAGREYIGFASSTSENIARRAMTELGDEGFLVLSFLCRHYRAKDSGHGDAMEVD